MCISGNRWIKSTWRQKRVQENGWMKDEVVIKNNLIGTKPELGGLHQFSGRNVWQWLVINMEKVKICSKKWTEEINIGGYQIKVYYGSILCSSG